MFGWFWVALGMHFGFQNCSNNRPKSNQNQVQFLTSLCSALGALQVPSWALTLLGRPRVPKTLKYLQFSKVCVSAGVRDVGALDPPLVAILAYILPTLAPNGPKHGPQIVPKPTPEFDDEWLKHGPGIGPTINNFESNFGGVERVKSSFTVACFFPKIAPRTA